MFETNQYQLLDFGRGRKLERFAGQVVERPAAAAAAASIASPSLWKPAHARYRRTRGQRGDWAGAGELPEQWKLAHGRLLLELRPTPFGHLGVFPEQAGNWDWIAQRVPAAGRPLNLLNLFAYTGGATMAAAAVGAKVTHLDAAANIVRWARGDAALSGLADASIRWIGEDARKFVQRELRRGNRYDGVILDPPSYGHGPKSQVWRIQRDLPPLLEACGELTDRRPQLFLLTWHSPIVETGMLEELVWRVVLGGHGPRPKTEALSLLTPNRRRLPCGLALRWPDS